MGSGHVCYIAIADLRRELPRRTRRSGARRNGRTALSGAGVIGLAELDGAGRVGDQQRTAWTGKKVKNSLYGESAR